RTSINFFSDAGTSWIEGGRFFNGKPIASAGAEVVANLGLQYDAPYVARSRTSTTRRSRCRRRACTSRSVLRSELCSTLPRAGAQFASDAPYLTTSLTRSRDDPAPMPTIHPTAFVHPLAIVLGDVTLGARASVWPTAVLRGDSDRIVVGAETNVQDGSVLHADHGLPALVG